LVDLDSKYFKDIRQFGMDWPGGRDQIAINMIYICPYAHPLSARLFHIRSHVKALQSSAADDSDYYLKFANFHFFSILQHGSVSVARFQRPFAAAHQNESS
jgi:hypothetical protein